MGAADDAFLDYLYEDRGYLEQQKEIEMPQYDNEMKFVLFVNDRKRNEKDADYTGTITIEGVEYYLNGWKRKNNVIGGTVKPKQARPTDKGSW